MSKVSLNDVVSNYNLNLINANFDKVEDELNNKVLYRNNPAGEPNSMQTGLDMNSNRIINLPEPLSPSEPARLADIKDLATVADKVREAKAAAVSAAASEGNAEQSALAALTAQQIAEDAVVAAQSFANGLKATSTTQHTFSTGTKVFNIESNKQFNGSQYVLISLTTDATKYMSARVTSYSGNALQVDVTGVEGSGTGNAWNIAISGAPSIVPGPAGVQGPAGPASTVPGPAGPAGPTGPAGPNVAIKDEGTTLTTSTGSVNFVGTGVTATANGSDVTVTISSGAGVPYASTPAVPTATGDAGVSTTYARGDHAHPSDAPLPATATPVAPGAAAVGVSVKYAREDHKHASDAPLASAVAPVAHGVAAVGTSAAYARADHKHPSDAPLAATSAPLALGTASIGTSDKYAREDHTHPDNSPQPSIVTPLVAGTATPGTSVRYAREDHVHPPQEGGGGSGLGLKYIGQLGLTPGTSTAYLPLAFNGGAPHYVLIFDGVKLNANGTLTFQKFTTTFGTSTPDTNASFAVISQVDSNQQPPKKPELTLLKSASGLRGFTGKMEIFNNNFNETGVNRFITFEAMAQNDFNTARWESFRAVDMALIQLTGFGITAVGTTFQTGNVRIYAYTN